MTHCYHSKSLAHMRVHSRCCIFYSLDRSTGAGTHHSSIMQSIFTVLKNSLFSTCLSLHPHLPSGNHRSFSCLPSFTFSRMAYSWSHTVFSLFELASFTYQHALKFPFQGSTAHLWVLNNIPLSGCTTPSLSIHLLKDILVISEFWQLWINLL